MRRALLRAVPLLLLSRRTASLATSTGSMQKLKLLSQQEATELDEDLMKTPGFSIDQLMELAGLSVAAAVQKQYPPCGMPTPDSMYLLQAIGALPAAGWDGASLEPNYKSWMKKVDRALCARVIPGAAFQPTQDYDMSVCEDDSLQVTYQTEHVE